MSDYNSSSANIITPPCARAASHDATHSERNDGPSLRSKQPYSCVACKKRKVRCNRAFPCLSCIETGLNCVPGSRAPYTRRRNPTVLERGATESSNLPVVAHGGNTSAPGPVPSFGQNLWQGLTDEFIEPAVSRAQGQDDILLASLGDGCLDASDLLLGATLRDSGYRNLYPLPMQASSLWQSFLQNVNPLSKVIHAPTVQSRISEAGREFDALDRPTVALLFAIYTASVMAMSDSECETNFGEPRNTLLSRYIFATQQALQAAGLMKLRSLTLLQAFTLHIIAARRLYSPQNIWLLSGTAVRMGQLLGLHQSPARDGLSVFDVQIRRRVWWQILLIDGRNAQLAGSQSTNQFSGAATFPLPGNFNDSDLRPEMSEEPAPHNGPTEMMFCLLRYELGTFLSTAAHTLNSHEVSLQEKDRLINDYEDRIESMYLRYCDTALPLHLLASGGARSALCKMRLMAHHPSQYPDRGKSIPQSEHDMLFATSVRMVEYDVLGKSTRSLDGFGWHTDIFFQLDAFVFMLIELRQQKPGPHVDKAWRLVEDVFRYHPILSKEGSGELGAEVAKLVLKAWETREAGSATTEFVPIPTPPIVTELRSQGEGESQYAYSIGTHGQVSVQQASDASMTDWDFWDNLLQQGVSGHSQEFMNSV